MGGRPAAQDRTAPQGVLPHLLAGDVGYVGGEGHVHHQGHVRLQGEGRTARSPAGVADLLLHGPHGHASRVGGGIAGQEAEGLQDHEGAHPVVDGPGGDPVPGQPEEPRVQDGGVPHAEPQLPHLLPGGGPHVHPEVPEFGDLLPLLGLHEVDGLLSHHPGHVAGAAQDPHPLAHQDLGVPAPDAIHVEEPLLVHVGDLEADLVHVTRQHDPPASGPRPPPRRSFRGRPTRPGPRTPRPPPARRGAGRCSKPDGPGSSRRRSRKERSWSMWAPGWRSGRRCAGGRGLGGRSGRGHGEGVVLLDDLPGSGRARRILVVARAAPGAAPPGRPPSRSRWRPPEFSLIGCPAQDGR
jgi:hypothetical protein